MTERVLIFVGLVLVAGAIVFHAMAGRYEIDGKFRLDRFTGERCAAPTFAESWHVCFRDDRK